MIRNKMISSILSLLFISMIFVRLSSVSALEVAPRISDKEIVERLTGLEDGQKRLDRQFEAVDKRFDDLRSEMNTRFEAVDKRFDDLRSEMNSRFDTLTWILGLLLPFL